MVTNLLQNLRKMFTFVLLWQKPYKCYALQNKTIIKSHYFSLPRPFKPLSTQFRPQFLCSHIYSINFQKKQKIYITYFIVKKVTTKRNAKLVHKVVEPNFLCVSIVYHKNEERKKKIAKMFFFFSIYLLFIFLE